MRLWELLLVIAGAGVVIEQLWEKVVVRVWRFVKFGEQHVRADPVLLEIANRFRPDGGTTLYDRIVNIEQNLEQLTNRVDVFIIGRYPGGERHTDPPT